MRAIQGIIQAIQLDPDNLELWARFASALRFVHFTKLDSNFKSLLIRCLEKPLPNHQDLAFAAISYLKLEPGFPWLPKDPLLLALMEKTLLVDIELEDALIDKHQREDYPPFLSAFAKQSALNECLYWSVEEEVHPSRSIDVLTPIKNGISLKVQEQYEENPYPRWSSLGFLEKKTFFQLIREKFPQLDLEEEEVPIPLEVLIAGCGTGQQALAVGKEILNSQVLAIDLSRNSLAYAEQKKEELKIDNVHFAQADILELSLEKRFFLIECTGVLHHMQDPIKGWKKLNELLAPGGFMRIALYSFLGRQDVRAARQLIQKKGFKPTLEGIRAARETLKRLPDHSLEKNVTKTIDFYSTSGCRDLLFHVQEHHFTLPQIAQILKELHLHFIGFENYSGTLEEASQYEQDHPSFFSAMYQFWVRGELA